MEIRGRMPILVVVGLPTSGPKLAKLLKKNPNKSSILQMMLKEPKNLTKIYKVRKTIQFRAFFRKRIKLGVIPSQSIR